MKQKKIRTKKKKTSTFQYVILETLEILFERWEQQQWMDDDDEEINYKWSEKHEQRGNCVEIKSQNRFSFFLFPSLFFFTLTCWRSTISTLNTEWEQRVVADCGRHWKGRHIKMLSCERLLIINKPSTHPTLKYQKLLIHIKMSFSACRTLTPVSECTNASEFHFFHKTARREISTSTSRQKREQKKSSAAWKESHHRQWLCQA